MNRNTFGGFIVGIYAGFSGEGKSMIFKIHKIWSLLDKNNWHFKYYKYLESSEIYKILEVILNNIDLESIHLIFWKNELFYLKKYNLENVSEDNKFITLKLDKNKLLEVLSIEMFDNLRLLYIHGLLENKIIFEMNLDNYGEYFSITINKLINFKDINKIVSQINLFESK